MATNPNPGNTSLLSFFASIMSRLAYEPPILYQLGLIEIMKILEFYNYKEDTFKMLKEAAEAATQADFITLLKDTAKMKPLVKPAELINQKLDVLKKEIYQEEGMKLSPQPTLLQRTNAMLAREEEMKNDAEEKTKGRGIFSSKPTAPPATTAPVAKPAAAPGKVNKYMTFDKLKSEYQQELLQSGDNIQTLYLQTGDDENVYVTAIKEANAIIVTFRGTQSLKNILSDINIILRENCAAGVEVKEAAMRDFGGVAKLADSTINMLMYSILYLSKTFLNKDKTSDQITAASIFCFGHSLGGGLTTYFAYEYIGARNKFDDEQKKYISESIVCISNGALRVLNKVAMDGFMELVKSNPAKIKFLRQWTKGDWVPTIPYEKLHFFHPKAQGVTTTFKTGQTWKDGGLGLGGVVTDYNKSLAGEFDVPTREAGFLGAIKLPTNPSNATAHCFQTYINYWGVASGASFGSGLSKSNVKPEDMSKKKAKKTLLICLIKIGAAAADKKMNPIQSIDTVIPETPIFETSTSASSVYMDDIESFEKFTTIMGNLKNGMSPSVAHAVAETVGVPAASVKQAQAAAEALITEHINFATSTCYMQQQKRQAALATAAAAAGGKGKKHSKKHIKKRNTKRKKDSKNRKTKKRSKKSRATKKKKNK